MSVRVRDPRWNLTQISAPWFLLLQDEFVWVDFQCHFHHLLRTKPSKNTALEKKNSIQYFVWRVFSEASAVDSVVDRERHTLWNDWIFSGGDIWPAQPELRFWCPNSICQNWCGCHIRIFMCLGLNPLYWGWSSHHLIENPHNGCISPYYWVLWPSTTGNQWEFRPQYMYNSVSLEKVAFMSLVIR